MSPCRHTTYYFWPWDVDATRVLGNISELSASLFSLWSQTEQNFYSKVESQLFIVLKQHDVKIGILGNLAPAPSQHIPEHQNICWIWSETQKSTFFFFLQTRPLSWNLSCSCSAQLLLGRTSSTTCQNRNKKNNGAINHLMIANRYEKKSPTPSTHSELAHPLQTVNNFDLGATVKISA